MTKTTCPTCGAKCISNPKYRDDYSAIPQPDLTKLREAFFKWFAWFDNNPQSKTERQLIMAVKELLEEK